MSSMDLTEINYVLKTKFTGTIEDMFQQVDGDFKKLQARKKDAKGGDVSFPVRVGRNLEGYAPTTTGGTLSEPGNQKFRNLTVDPKLMYMSMKVDGPAQARSKGGTLGTYISAIMAEMKYGVIDFRKQLNRQVHGSEEGFLAKIKTVTDGTDTLNVYQSGVAPATNSYGVAHNFGTQYLIGEYESATVPRGQRVSIIDSDGTTVHLANLAVKSVNHSTGDCVFVTNANAAVDFSAVAAGDFIAAYDPEVAAGGTWVNPEMEGMRSGIDDGTVRTSYHGLSRTTHAVLKTNVITPSATVLTDLSPGLLQQALNAVMKNGNLAKRPGKDFEWCCSLGLEAEFLALQSPGRRYDSNTYDGGTEAPLTYGGVPFRPSVDAPAEEIKLLNWKFADLWEVQPIKWIDEDGNALHRIHGTDRFEIVLRYMAECVWRQQQNMAKIVHLKETEVDYRF